MDSMESDPHSVSMFSPPVGAVPGSAHPKVVRALKLMRDIHWDTSGASPVGSATDYTPITIRNINDIKRDARARLLKNSKVSRGYHIAQLNPTSRHLRPMSANAILIGQIYKEEEEKKRDARQKLRRSQSKTLERVPSRASAVVVNKLKALPSSDALGIYEDNGNDDCVESTPDKEESVPNRPLSGAQPKYSSADSVSVVRGGGRGPHRPGSGKHQGGLKVSGRVPSPTSGSKIANDSSLPAKPDLFSSKLKSMDNKQITDSQKEEDALRKIEEKRNRVIQKQLTIDRRDQQTLWLKYIAIFNRAGLMAKTVLKSRNQEASVKLFCLSQNIVIKVLKWWRPVRINLWKRKNERLVKRLYNFFLIVKLKCRLKLVRSSTSLVGRFLRDVLNSGERFKKMRRFRVLIMKFQMYVRSFLEIRRSRIGLLKMALDKIVLEKLNKLKRDKAKHELMALNKLKYKRDFGPTVVKIEKITLFTNQLLTASSTLTSRASRRRRPHLAALDTAPQVLDSNGHDAAAIPPTAWYPGGSFSGFGVDAGGRPPHPKYTSRMICDDLNIVLAKQRRRHILAAAEQEASARANKGVFDVGLSRVKKFLKDSSDLGPMVEESGPFKIKRQVFLLLTCGALLELEEIAGAVVQEYIDAEAEKQGLHVIV